MGNDTVAGGSRRTVALAAGKRGVFVSINGGDTERLKVEGDLNTEALAASLGSLNEPDTTLLVIGTRSDGTPGLNDIDPVGLRKALPDATIAFLSEAQAMQHALSPEGVNAYVILATALREPADGEVVGNIIGSARWWVQQPDGKISSVPVTYLGNQGDIYTIGGGSLVTSPDMIAGMVETLLADHPTVTRVCVWSQDGLSGNADYMDEGKFFVLLRLPEQFVGAGGHVVIMPSATDMIQLTSGAGPLPVPAVIADDTTDPADEE